jgi:hypothetical protein
MSIAGSPARMSALGQERTSTLTDAIQKSASCQSGHCGFFANLQESFLEKAFCPFGHIVSLKNPTAHEPQFDDRQRICGVTV